MDIWNGVSKNMPKTMISLRVLVDCNGPVPNKRVGFVVKKGVLKVLQLR